MILIIFTVIWWSNEHTEGREELVSGHTSVVKIEEDAVQKFPHRNQGKEEELVFRTTRVIAVFRNQGQRCVAREFAEAASWEVELGENLAGNEVRDMIQSSIKVLRYTFHVNMQSRKADNAVPPKCPACVGLEGGFHSPLVSRCGYILQGHQDQNSTASSVICMPRVIHSHLSRVKHPRHSSH